MKKSGGWKTSSKAYVCAAIPWEKDRPIPSDPMTLGFESAAAALLTFKDASKMRMRTMFCLEVD